MSTAKITMSTVALLGALGLVWFSGAGSVATEPAGERSGSESHEPPTSVPANVPTTTPTPVPSMTVPGVEVANQDDSTEPYVPTALTVWRQISKDMEGKFVVPANWSPPEPKPKPGANTPMPHLDTKLDPSGKLQQAMRWFESLPAPVPEPKVLHEARSERMAAAGLELERRECRGDVCLLSFRYSKKSSEKLRRRLGPQGSVHARDSWLSITTIDADGRVEGHVFMRHNDEHWRMK